MFATRRRFVITPARVLPERAQMSTSHKACLAYVIEHASLLDKTIMECLTCSS